MFNKKIKEVKTMKRLASKIEVKLSLFFTVFIIALVVLPTVVGSVVAEAGSESSLVVQYEPQKVKPKLDKKLIDPSKLKLTCPDPAVQSIKFDIASRTSEFEGRVKIVGTIKNVGTANFESGPGQQELQLWETNPGGSPRLVATKPFEKLAKDEIIFVQYERDWNSSSPAEGEFPPTYKLVISYDPDINIDDNKKNDDCETENNSMEQSGAEINTLFR